MTLRKTAVLLLLLGGTALALSACKPADDDEANVSVVKSMLGENWSSSAWENASTDTYTYDGSGRLVTLTEENWSGSAWVNSGKEVYTYDGSDRVTEKLEQTWSGSAWEDNERTLYTYALGRLSEERDQNQVGSAWEDESSWDYSYDASGKLVGADGYDESGATPVLDDQIVWTYDANGRVIEETKQHDSGSGLQNFILYEYTYDPGTGLLDTMFVSFWSSGWSESLRTRYQYTAGGRISRMEISSDQGVNWTTRIDVDYSGDQLVTETFSTWNGSAWAPSSRHTYSWGTAGGRVLPEHSHNEPLRQNLFKLYGEELNRYLGQ